MLFIDHSPAAVTGELEGQAAGEIDFDHPAAAAGWQGCADDRRCGGRVVRAGLVERDLPATATRGAEVAVVNLESVEGVGVTVRGERERQAVRGGWDGALVEFLRPRGESASATRGAEVDRESGVRVNDVCASGAGLRS
jgi:hypothetical protein